MDKFHFHQIPNIHEYLKEVLLLRTSKTATGGQSKIS
uniref:Uncharacterized protein n=1 Tax=Rhizophora mucronata TaxID=61149 RepID=A0A2P2PD71_RHIMU